MKQDSINILKATHSKDSISRDITTWVIDTNIQEDFQSFKYNANYKPYGITDKTSNVVYSKNPTLVSRYYLPDDNTAQFNITYRIGFNNRQYRIVSILPYKKHMEIYLELVI